MILVSMSGDTAQSLSGKGSKADGDAGRDLVIGLLEKTAGHSERKQQVRGEPVESSPGIAKASSYAAR